MIYVFGEYELDPEVYELRHRGAPRKVEPQVFDVLSYLVQRHGRVVPKQELMEHVWPDSFISEAALSSRLMSARKAIGDSGQEQRFIRTVHRRGFRFVGEVELREKATHDLHPTGAGARRPAAKSIPAAVAVSSLPKPAPASGAVFAHASVTRPIGREAELELLWQRLEAALGGTRQVVFVTGEAGIGKTTVVDAFLAEAGAKRRLRIAYGQCLESLGPGEPYLPLLDALGRMCREEDGAETVALLARYAPTWLIQMPWLINEADLASLQQRVLGNTRDRMLREIVDALEAMAAAEPLALVLEDLHWSDHATLDLIAWLGRRREPARVLVIGTYRPSDAEGHPLRIVQQELQVRGQCHELALPFLSEAATEAYMGARFPGVNFPVEVTRLLHERTEGNPLFMDNVLSAWVSEGKLERTGGSWALQVNARHLAAGVPDTLRQLIAQQLERLAPAEQEVLEAASAAGAEFTAAGVAAGSDWTEEDVEAQCDRLSSQGRFLRSVSPTEWPDGTVSARYEFIHSLYQEALYDRIPPARRARLHRQIGDRLEKGHSPSLLKPAAELAFHFIRGREPQRAVQYLQLAAEQALSRSAYHEATNYLNTALELLQAVPATPETAGQELQLLVTLCQALIATKGWASPEVERAYTRAQELGQSLEDAAFLTSVRFGLATLHEYRGEYEKSQSLMEEHIRLEEPALLIEAHELLACSTFHQGKFAVSVQHADQGLALCTPDTHSLPLARFGENPAVSYHDWAALALWFMGYPDTALARARHALDMAQERVYSLATAQVHLAFVHQHRGETAPTREWAEKAITVGTEQGFPFRVAQATIVRGWALVAEGQVDEGLEELKKGLAAYDDSGACMDRPYYLGLLADVHRMRGASAEGLEVVAEAVGMILSDRPFFYEAELHRLNGLLMLLHGENGDAEAIFRQALEVAREQRAKSVELRVAMNLAKVWSARGKSADGIQLLGEALGAFSEGADTPDQRRARAALEQLGR